MRVLHLDTGREMRGGQWQVLRLHEGLLRRRVDSRLLAREGSPLYQAAAGAGLRVEAISWGKVLRLSRGVDIVHVHDSRSHTMAALTGVVPLVVSRRVAFPVKGGWSSRWKYGRARRFLAVSQFVAVELVRAGIGRERIDVVYDGVPIPATSAVGERVITPYSTDPAKCMDLALAAGEMYPSKDLERDLPTARALVYLSTSEGLGSGILLAMAHGVPVIASRVGGIPELIDDGVDGLLVDNSSTAIAAALTRVDRRMGEAARHKVMTRFTVERMVTETLESYGRL